MVRCCSPAQKHYHDSCHIFDQDGHGCHEFYDDGGWDDCDDAGIVRCCSPVQWW